VRERGRLNLTEDTANAVSDLVRSPVRSESFFIDQIRINQKNERKKSRQVLKMGEMYYHSHTVLKPIVLDD
jgi:hypothetical protein